MAMNKPSQFAVVETPYGRCVVRDQAAGQNKLLCTPITWQLAEYSSSQPKFYMNEESISPVKYAAGDLVWSQYGGEGKVERVTESHLVVTLKNWQLADGKSPTQYLQNEAVVPLSDHDFVEKTKMDVVKEKEKNDPKKKRDTELREGIDKAVALKNEAASHFKKSDFSNAQKSYLQALEFMNKMGYDMPDPFRAEVLEHTIPCHNNIALCCIKQKNYDEAKIYANNGVMLIDAMESQISKTTSKVWEEFQKRGMSLEKLTKDWKKKSLFYKGKACLLQRDYDGACENFDLALRLVKDDPKLGTQAKELADFFAQAKKLKAVALRKEKDTWKKAFNKNTKEGKTETPAPAPASAVAPQVASPPRNGASAKAKVDVSKYIKGAASSSSGSSSSNGIMDGLTGAASNSSDGLPQSTSGPSPSEGSSEAPGGSEGPDKGVEDNLAMYLLGGAVALVVGMGAYSVLTRRR